MAKTGVLKKVAALTAAFALVGSFAVSASAAVGVETTTTYGADASKINVSVNVTGVANGTMVTYYATNTTSTLENNVVYVNQTNAKDGADFTFTTDASYLEGTAVLAGADGEDTPAQGAISGRAVNVTGDGITAAIKYVPNGATTATIVVPCTASVVANAIVTSGNATVTALSLSGGNLTISLRNITGTDAIAVAVEAADNVADVSAQHIDSAATNGAENETEAGNGKITVLAKVAGEVEEFGILTSASAIADGSANDLSAYNAYKALGRNATGHFAVQLIGDASENSIVKLGTTYYTAVYYKVASTYYIVAGEEVVVPAQ